MLTLTLDLVLTIILLLSNLYESSRSGRCRSFLGEGGFADSGEVSWCRIRGLHTHRSNRVDSSADCLNPVVA